MLMLTQLDMSLTQFQMLWNNKNGIISFQYSCQALPNAQIYDNISFKMTWKIVLIELCQVGHWCMTPLHCYDCQKHCKRCKQTSLDLPIQLILVCICQAGKHYMVGSQQPPASVPCMLRYGWHLPPRFPFSFPEHFSLSPLISETYTPGCMVQVLWPYMTKRGASNILTPVRRTLDLVLAHEEEVPIARMQFLYSKFKTKQKKEV